MSILREVYFEGTKREWINGWFKQLILVVLGLELIFCDHFIFKFSTESEINLVSLLGGFLVLTGLIRFSKHFFCGMKTIMGIRNNKIPTKFYEEH